MYVGQRGRENANPELAMGAKRSWTRSPIVAGIVGVFAGGLTVLLMETFGHAVFGAADPANPGAITTPMFAAVLVAWVAGCAVAGSLSTFWARSTSIVLGLVTGLILLGGSVANMVAIPHPTWMVVGAVVLMPTAAMVAAVAVARANSTTA